MTIFVDVTPCTLNPKPESPCEAVGLLRHLVPRNDETDQIGKYFLKPETLPLRGMTRQTFFPNEMNETNEPPK